MLKFASRSAFPEISVQMILQFHSREVKKGREEVWGGGTDRRLIDAMILKNPGEHPIHDQTENLRIRGVSISWGELDVSRVELPDM